MNELNKNNLKFISELSTLSNQLRDSKLQLEKTKYNYFMSSKNTLEQEQKIKNLSNNPNIKENSLKQQIDILVNYQMNSTNAEQSYKEELQKMNQKINEAEEKYNYIIENLKTEESSRIQYFINILNKFSQTLGDHNDNIKNYMERIEKIAQNINIKRDLKIFDNLIVYRKNDKKRFSSEIFLNFNVYKKTELNIVVSKLKKFESLFFKNNEKILGVETFTNFDRLEIIQLQNEEIGEKDLVLDKNIEKLIKNKDPITNEELMYIINKIETKNNNSKLFLKSLSNYYQNNSFVEIKCLNNLYHLSNFLSILINNIKSNKIHFYLNFIIIYIAEKTIYYDINNSFNNYYLSKLLKNKNITQIDFWKELIEKKIASVAELQIKRKIMKKNENIQENGIYDKLKGLFSEEKIKENKQIEDKIIYEQLYEKNLNSFALEIMNEYIQHFSNFNCQLSDSTELIVEISSKYKFDTNYVNYFISKLNSNMFNVKKTFFDNIEKKIDYENLYFSSSYYKHKNITDSKLKILLNTLQYFNLKEMPILLSLNKTYYHKLQKFLYKNILLKYHNMNIKNHLNIWKILLNYNKIKNQYNYKKILEEIKNNPEIVPTRDVIKLDVARTSFIKDKDTNREKILNILNAVSKESPSITYCQGMNYIASFLLTITQSEEESFYIFLSLLFYTEYGDLFKNDLENLKKYFYVFERLINIFLPELYFYFIQNNINVSFFVSSWFITLFTTAFQYNTNLSNPKIFLRILDLFIFSGWKSIIKIGLAVIKHFEPKLLFLTDENLLHFLLNDIIKSGFFENENFDTLMFITINFKIESGLISNIENEYEIKSKIPSFGTKNIIDLN